MSDMGKLRYFVIVNDDNLALAREVTALLEAGWTLRGDVQLFSAMDVTGVVKMYLAQALERSEVSK